MSVVGCISGVPLDFVGVSGQISRLRERIREKGREGLILNIEMSYSLSTHMLNSPFEPFSGLFYENKSLLREYWIRFARLKHEYH